MRFVLLLALCLLPQMAMALHFPVPVTITTTDLALTPVAGTGNSTVSWTLIQGSKALVGTNDSMSQALFYVSEPTGRYTLQCSYNSLTWTIVNDWWPIYVGTVEFRPVNLPNGAYFRTTFTGVDAGTSGLVQIKYDSYR